MRIAVLHNHPIHYKHLLFTALASLGAEVDVIFAARSTDLRSAWLQPTGENYQSHFLSDGSFESLPQIRTALRAVGMAKRCQPDVVIIGGYSYLAAWSILTWATVRHTPIALWFESNMFDHPRQPAKEMVKRMFVSACDVGHVYGISNREYLEHLGMKASAIIEKKATVDSSVFMRRRAAFHSDFRRFVYVGRFSPEKNLPRLLEAFRIAHLKSRAELVLVGHGPDELLLRQMTRDLGLNEAVVFTGPKTQDEVSQTLMGSDCLVLPSLSEPWGLVSIEALCTGIPVVVSNRCGCARNVVTEETGWTFPAEDTEELARTLAEVCSLPLERLQKMGEAAVKLSAEYSPDACAKRILANLEELLARHRGALGGINGDA
jgi:glycosyltransferase involved in cell wall biosynthesis